MRRAPEDDLEVLPIDVHTLADLLVAGDDPAGRRTPRRSTALTVAAIVAAVVTIGATVTVLAQRGRDSPTRDVRAIVDTWTRAREITDVADRAAVRVRILVPTYDSDSAFRGLAAVRAEERDRLHALAADVTALDTHDTEIGRARDALTRALSVRERRARVAAEFYAGGGEGVRNLESIERGMATTAREVTDALAQLQRRHPVDPSPRRGPALRSVALGRSLGRLARVTDTPVGRHLLLNVDGRLVDLDPDAGTTGRVRTLALFPSIRTLVTLDDGTVLAWAADSEVRVIARPGRVAKVGPVIASGRPIGSERHDAFWVTTGNLTSEVALDGTTLAGPFRQPVEQIVGTTPQGLVVFDPGPNGGRPIVGLWSPPDPTILPVVEGIFVGASHDRIVTERCGPDGACTLHVTDARTGATTDIEPAAPGLWSYGFGTVSPDGRWLATAAHRTDAAQAGLLFLDVRSHETRFVRTSPRPEDSPGALSWDADSDRVFFLDERGSTATWASPDSATLHGVRFQVAFDRLIRVRDVAVAPAQQ